MNDILEPKVIGKCYWCKEDVYDTEAFEFDGVLYCSTSCIVDDLKNRGDIINLSE